MGIAGLSDFCGTDPVPATQMMPGLVLQVSSLNTDGLAHALQANVEAPRRVSLAVPRREAQADGVGRRVLALADQRQRAAQQVLGARGEDPVGTLL